MLAVPPRTRGGVPTPPRTRGGVPKNRQVGFAMTDSDAESALSPADSGELRPRQERRVLERQRPSLLLVALLLLLAVMLWGCWDDSSPTPWQAEPSATIWPLWTRAVAAESTLSVVETLVEELAVACGELWDGCCAPATLQAEQGAVATLTAAAPVVAAVPVATVVPVATYTPRPTQRSALGAVATYTPYPSATAEPYLCRRCIVDDAVLGCPGGYVCEACDTCYFLCVCLRIVRAPGATFVRAW
jgi:hypothetical protein